MTQITSLRIGLMLIVVLFVSIFAPDFYWKANKHENTKTNVFYSPITKGFVFTKSDVRGTYHTDAKGAFYTRDDFERLLPFLNFRQLMLAGKLPDTLDGVAIPPKAINLNNFNLRVTPASINVQPLQIFPLMESASGRLRLELPPDFFRIRDRMEFITSITNSINEEKSVVFTNALVAAGFSFPAQGIYGNPSTKKPFDEGYFVVDAAGKVFHLKMVKGAPYCKDTGIPADLDIATIVPIENELRQSYGLIITKKSEAYFISYKKYALIKLPIEQYDREAHTLFIKGDIFYRIFAVNQENGYHAVVTNRKYDVIDRTSSSWPGNDVTPAGIAAAYAFPFTIAIEKESTAEINFYVRHAGLTSILASIASLLIAVLYLRKKRVPVRRAAVFYVLVALTGVYGVAALLTVRDFDDDPRLTRKP